MKTALNNYYLFLLLSLFFHTQTKAQDLIVKTNGDSIFCKINTVATLYIAYSIKETGKPIKKTIPLKEVKTYLYNTTKSDSVDIETAINDAYSKGFFVSGGYGLGMLIGPQPQNLPPLLDDYLNDLRSGRAFHFNLAYFPLRIVGFGLHYSLFHTQNDGGLIGVTNAQGGVRIGRLSDDIRIQYIAPCIQIKLGKPEQVFTLNSSFGMGYSKYDNNAVFIDPHKIKAESLGTHAYLWLEVNLGKHLALIGGAGLFFTAFKEFEIDYFTLGNKFTFTPTDPDNNNRYDLFFGARYNF